MSITNSMDVRVHCYDKAIKIASIISGETEEKLRKRSLNDAKLNCALSHLERMYFEFETNESFKREKYLKNIENNKSLGEFKMEYECEWVGLDDLNKGDK